MDRREFMKNAGMAVGLGAPASYGGKQIWDAREHREDTVRTPGFMQSGVETLLEKTARGEPQNVNVYLLAEEDPMSHRGEGSQNYDWEKVVRDAEDMLSDLHPNVKPDMNYMNLTPEELAEKTNKSFEEAQEHLQGIKKPSFFPGYCANDINNLDDDLEPFDIDDEGDVDVYISDFSSFSIGKAITSYGEAYVDNSDLDSEKMASKAIAHELGHLYGLSDTYGLISSGEGLMGADPEETHISDSTDSDFEEIMSDMGCCH